MAATRAAWSALPSMRTSLVSRSTLTAATPATLATSSVTATLQWSQVMPGTRYVEGVMEGFVRFWKYGPGVFGRNRTTYPRGVSYTLGHGHHHRNLTRARVHRHQGAAPEAPQARGGAGA